MMRAFLRSLVRAYWALSLDAANVGVTAVELAARLGVTAVRMDAEIIAIRLLIKRNLIEQSASAQRGGLLG